MKILTAIPWFVWLLFGYVILRGVKERFTIAGYADKEDRHRSCYWSPY